MLIQPRPEESSYSLLTRAHLQIGSTSPADSLQRVTGTRGYKPLSCLPTQIEEVVKRLGISLTADHWIDNHTLFPMFRPFLPIDRIGFVLESMKQYGAAKSRLGLLRSHCGANEQRAYCRQCNELAIYNFGHAYWSRSHLLAGVCICTRHQSPLCLVQEGDLPWKGRALTMPEAGTELSISDRQIAALSFIAEQLREILNDGSDTHVRHSMYVDILRDAGLYTAKGRVRARRLTSAIRRWLLPVKGMRPYDQLYTALDVERNWATISIACEGGFTHPLKHAVIWGALGCEWRSLVDAGSTKGFQQSLELEFAAIEPLGDSAMREVLGRHSTLSAAAKEIGCDISTMAVWADKLGCDRVRKPKKINIEVRKQIIEEAEKGSSSSSLAEKFGISVTTVNRIKRSVRT